MVDPGGARGGGPLARLFGSLANALLDVGLPRIQAWLRERLGPEADVAHVTMDGAFIHLEGVRLPLGPRGVIHLARATARVASARGLGMPEMRLHAFEGELRFGAAEADASLARTFRAEIAFRSAPDPAEDAWIAGDLAIPRATWSHFDDAMEGAARLVVTSDAWRLEGGTLAAGSAAVRFHGEGSLEATGRTTDAVRAAGLALDHAKVGPFFDAIQAILGRALEVPPGVPLDARLSGELGWDASAGGRCNLHVSADERGHLALDVVGGVRPDGAALEARVTGSVAPAAALRGAGVPARFLPREEDSVAIALEVTGDVEHPIVRGSLRAAALGFRFGRPRFVPVLVASDLVVDVDATAALARVRATARAGRAALAIDADLPTRVAEGRRVTARLDDLDASWIAAIAGAALAGRGPSVDALVPRDARAHAAVTLTPNANAGLDVRGVLGASTPRSRLTIDPLVLADDMLDATRLTCVLALEDLLATGLLTGPVAPTPAASVTFALALGGSPRAPVVEGRFGAAALELAVVARPDLPPLRAEALEGVVHATRTKVRLRDVRFRAFGGDVRADANLPPADGEPTLIIQAQGASAELVEAAARFGGGRLRVEIERDGARPPDAIWLSRSARVFGEARVFADRAVRAELALETAAGTALVGSFAVSPAHSVAGGIRGNVAFVDALLAGAFAGGAVRPLPDGAFRLDAELAGSLDDVVASGFATSERVLLSAGDDAPVFAVTDVATLFHADARSFAWHRLSARAYGGALASAGVVEQDRLRASLSLRGVAVDHLPLDREGTTRLGAEICGVLGLAMRFERRDASAVVGRGEASLERASFPALRRARAALERYGLKPPDERATAPVTVAMDVGAHGWRFRELSLALRGCSATGEIWLRTEARDPALSGMLVVTAEDELLRTSTLLVVPGVLAERVVLPVRLRGTLEHPIFDADLAALLGRFVSDNRVSNFVSGAVGEVMETLLGREAAAPAPPAPPPPNEDERTHADPRASESDVDWDALERRLDAYRRAGARVRVG